VGTFSFLMGQGQYMPGTLGKTFHASHINLLWNGKFPVLPFGQKSSGLILPKSGVVFV
jgi:hypothetical protein